VIADGFGTELVFADRLQHPPKRRGDDAQHQQESQQCHHEQQIVGNHLAVDDLIEQRLFQQTERRTQKFRHGDGQAIVAARPFRELAGHHAHAASDGQRHHGVEDSLHAQQSTPISKASASGTSMAAPSPISTELKLGPRCSSASPRRKHPRRKTWCAQTR
jgi:hypothetical protein